MRRRQRRQTVLVICDDKDNLEGARRMLPSVITSRSESAWEAIWQRRIHLYAVLIDIEDFQRGIALALLAVKAGSFYVGLIAETVPDEMDASVFSINGTLLSIDHEKKFPLDPDTEPDGIGTRNWRRLFRSLVTEGPAIISVPVRI